MNIDHSSYTNSGGRPKNEDSLFCRSDCFLVADGLGGHENGEEASAQAIQYVSGNYSGNISDKAVSDLLSGADEAVRLNGDGGKSTLAALFFSGNTARFANVGDSRVYYFRNGKILARTKDHSVCQASIDMGELNPDEVRGSDDRSGLFKVLGADRPLKVPKLYDTVAIQDGDAFLLCSDGFWEYVYEMEMEADLLKSECAADWLRHMVKRLLLRSENAGDNYTAICGIIHAPESVSAPKRRVCSPVIIACLAVSLAALGAVTALKLLNPADTDSSTASPPMAATEETSVSAFETQDSTETSDAPDAATSSAASQPMAATEETSVSAFETQDSTETSDASDAATDQGAAQLTGTTEQSESGTIDSSQESPITNSTGETEISPQQNTEVSTND